VTFTRARKPLISALTSVCLRGQRPVTLPLESVIRNAPAVVPDCAKTVGGELVVSKNRVMVAHEIVVIAKILESGNGLRKEVPLCRNLRNISSSLDTSRYASCSRGAGYEVPEVFPV